MPKIINNRIYMECELHDDSYSNEMNKIIELALDKHLIIWDQSEQEKINEEKLFDIYLSSNKSNEDGIKIFDRHICRNLAPKLQNSKTPKLQNHIFFKHPAGIHKMSQIRAKL